MREGNEWGRWGAEVLQSLEVGRQGCKLDPRVHFVFYHTSIAPDASMLAGHNRILFIFGSNWTKYIESLRDARRITIDLVVCCVLFVCRGASVGLMHATCKVKNVFERVYHRFCRRMSRRALTRETMSALTIFYLLVGVFFFLIRLFVPLSFWECGAGC